MSEKRLSFRVGNAYNGDTFEVSEDGVTLYLFDGGVHCDQMFFFSFKDVFNLLLAENECPDLALYDEQQAEAAEEARAEAKGAEV